MKPKDSKYIPENIDKKSIVLLSVILIIFLGFAVYFNSVHGAFIYDDDLLIKNNTYIKQWPCCLGKIFTEDIGKSAGVEYKFYRPIQILTYAIDYHLWKLNTTGYHLNNIFLHILVALCIYWLINCIFHENILALFAGILFVVHPINTSVVSYISSRADSLYLLFTLLTFIFYIKSLYAGKAAPLFFMVLSYALALLSKENSLILPALLLLFHYTFKERVRPREFFSLIGVIFFYVILRMTLVISTAPLISYHPSTLLQRIPGFFVAVTNYIRLLFLPLDLHIGYEQSLFSFSHPQAIIGLVIFAALVFSVFKMRNRSQLIFFSLAWFLLTLLPVSNLYPINAYMAENWLYLPSIGFFLILAGGLSLLYKRAGFKIAAVILIAGLTGFYSYLTIKQNDYWKEPIAFYARTLKYAPTNATVLNNLGIAYQDAGRNEEAMAMYKKSVEFNPKAFNARNNLGILYDNLGRKEEAIDAYKKAIEIDPHYVPAYNNLGALYFKIGNMDEAMSLYNMAIKLNPYFVEGYVNLAMVYSVKGERKEAIAAYARALELYPDYALAHNNLAELYYENGDYAQAIKHCDKAIVLGYNVRPEFLQALRSRR